MNKLLTYKGRLQIEGGRVIFGGYVGGFENGEYEVTLKLVKPVLAPCPFCGEDPRVLEDKVSFAVNCDYCGARGPRLPADKNNQHLRDHVRQDAIIAWNRRVMEKLATIKLRKQQANLLAACEAIAKTHGADYDCNCDECKAIRQVRSAIAEARGETGE